MTETTIQENTTYTLNDLTIEDLEIICICIGLDSVDIPRMHNRAKELTVIIEDIMPPTGSVDSE